MLKRCLLSTIITFTTCLCLILLSACSMDIVTTTGESFSQGETIIEGEKKESTRSAGSETPEEPLVKDEIEIDFDEYDFLDLDHITVKTELEKKGFVNIKETPEVDYKSSFLNGMVFSITIDGNSSFSKGDVFKKEAEIILSYYLFKEREIVYPEYDLACTFHVAHGKNSSKNGVYLFSFKSQLVTSMHVEYDSDLKPWIISKIETHRIKGTMEDGWYIISGGTITHYFELINKDGKLTVVSYDHNHKNREERWAANLEERVEQLKKGINSMGSYEQKIKALSP